MSDFWAQLEAQLVQHSDHQNNPESPPQGDREPLRMILIGSPEAVRDKIAYLHTKGIKDRGLWSRLMPTQKPGQVMSICTFVIRNS